jgi:DNA-binding XRE family transcriptional regulator
VVPSEPYCFRMSDKRPLVTVTDGAKIRELRESRLGINASQFARRLGIQPHSMINIEKGHRSPSLALLAGIARELNVPMEHLLREAA